MKLLVDEMFPRAVAERLRAVGVDAVAVADLSLAGSSDGEVFSAAAASGRAVLTENVSDFARIAAQHNVAGGRHHGLLIALSSRFSRRPAGIACLVAAIRAVGNEQLDDRVVYLRPAERV